MQDIYVNFIAISERKRLLVFDFDVTSFSNFSLRVKAFFSGHSSGIYVRFNINFRPLKRDAID